MSGSHYLCYQAGLELAFDPSNRVNLVVFNRNRGQWAQYTGTLPSGLLWTDTKAVVDRKLGAPDSTYSGLNGIRAWAQYKGGAVTVTYDTLSGPAGTGAALYDIRIK